MSKPEVARRDEYGDRIAVIHAYAPGDGYLSFVAKDPRTNKATSPSPTREECAAACPEGWELYNNGTEDNESWRARKIETAPEPEETAEPETIGTATYSPEDNKLRIYPFARLSAEDYARVKAAGVRWAPKQELFVAPSWTPSREDFARELCGDIEDEDTSLIDRAEAKADRLGARL